MLGIYEYYLSGRRIGVYNPNCMKEHFLILQNTLGNELSHQIRDEINSFDKSEIQKEAEETKQVQDYARELGIEEIKNIYSIEIPPREEKQKATKKSETEKTTKNQKAEEGKTEEVKPIKTKVTDVNVKQAIELSERANDLQDMKKWLGGNIPPEFTKLVVIDSRDMSQMKGENGQNLSPNSTRYDLAIVDKENHIEPLKKYVPELEQRTASGNNPTAQKYQVNKEGKVEKDAILSEYEIGEKIVQIDNKEMGRVEVNIGKEEHTGKETLGAQVRDSNSIYATTTEMRSVMGEYEENGVRNVDENLKEIKQHENSKPECEKEHSYKDIDGDLDTVSHGYMTDEYIIDEKGNKYTYEELATRWGKYADDKLDKEGVKDWLEEQKEENPEITVEELIEKGDEENEDPRAPEQRM